MEAVERSEKMSVFAGKEPLISPGHPALSLVTVMIELSRQHQNMRERVSDLHLRLWSKVIVCVSFKVAE